jgi:predicted PurR-regulated permease PerM
VVRVILVVFAAAATLWILHALRGVILLVVLAIFFAYLVAPLVEAACRPFTVRGREHAMPRAPAIGVVYLLVLGVLALAAALLLPPVGTQIGQLAREAPSYLDRARTRTLVWTTSYEAYRLPAAVRDAIDNGVTHAVEVAGNYVTEGLGNFLIQFLGYVPWLMLIPVLAFFLLKDSASFRAAALHALPHGRWRWRGRELLQDVNATLALYIRAQLIACLLIGTVCTIGFYLIGLRYALVLGLVSGCLEFIPLVGPVVVVLLAALIAGFSSIEQALGVVVFLGILRIIQDYVIYPRIIGHGMRLHPFVVIVAVLCGAALAGVLGIFVAIPTVAILSVAYRHWLEHTGSEGLVTDLLQPGE